MQTTVLTLIKDPTQNNQKASGLLCKLAKLYFPSAKVLEHNSKTQFNRDLSYSLSSCDITVIGVETRLFNSTKMSLFNATGIDTYRNPSIAQKLLPGFKNGKLSEKSYHAHTEFAKNSTVFETENGSFSGFVISEYDQHILFLPLEPKLIRPMLDNYVREFFKSFADAETKEKADRILRSDMLKKIESKLSKNGQTISFGERNSPAILKALGDINNDNETILTSNFKRPLEKNESINKYIADIALECMVDKNSHFGTAISRIYLNKETNLPFVLVAAANHNGAKVIRICADETDTPAALISSAQDALLRLVLELIDPKKSQDLDGYEALETDEIDRKSPVIVYLSVLAGVALAIFATFVVTVILT